MARAAAAAQIFQAARAPRAGSDIPWGLRAPESPAAHRFARAMSRLTTSHRPTGLREIAMAYHLSALMMCAPAHIPGVVLPQCPLIHPHVTVYDPLRLE
jgi:hypothetical protein